MTKLQIMKKIADYRREYDHYDMGVFVCEHFAKKLPKWVLEEILMHCDFKHSVVMHKDHVYTYWHDTYKHDFDYYPKLKKGHLFDSLEWLSCDSHGVCEVVHV